MRRAFEKLGAVPGVLGAFATEAGQLRASSLPAFFGPEMLDRIGVPLVEALKAARSLSVDIRELKLHFGDTRVVVSPLSPERLLVIVCQQATDLIRLSETLSELEPADIALPELESDPDAPEVLLEPLETAVLSAASAAVEVQMTPVTDGVRTDSPGEAASSAGTVEAVRMDTATGAAPVLEVDPGPSLVDDSRPSSTAVQPAADRGQPPPDSRPGPPPTGDSSPRTGQAPLDSTPASLEPRRAFSTGQDLPFAFEEAVPPSGHMPPGGRSETTSSAPNAVSPVLIRTPLSKEARAQLQLELARFVGPVASLLVAEALRSDMTVPALVAHLADEIEAEGDRQAFLAATRGLAR